MNVIARLEYELAYYDSAVHRFNHYTTRTPPGIVGGTYIRKRFEAVGAFKERTTEDTKKRQARDVVAGSVRRNVPVGEEGRDQTEPRAATHENYYRNGARNTITRSVSVCLSRLASVHSVCLFKLVDAFLTLSLFFRRPL